MDKAIKTLLRYEWAAFIRNKFQILMAGVIFIFGLYAIYYGQAEMKVQQDTILEVLRIQEEEFHQYQVSFKEELASVEEERKLQIASDPAYAWHRHGYHAILPPHDYATLAIGQRDLFPYYYRLTGMSLYYQLFENELANPVKLYVGNFDLSFVIIYLFPLLIIAFTYGLYSGEKENGILPLLAIQSISIRKILLIRLAFYFVLITGMAVIISLAGILTSGNNLDTANTWPAIMWLAGVVIYCVFWFGLLFLIISFRNNSSFNALTGVGCWLLFLIVIPAILNVMLSTKYPINSTALAGLTRRTSFEDDNDDEEVTEVIMEFLAKNPELAGSDSLVQNNKLAKAYAAFTFLKDLNSREEVGLYNTQISNRSKETALFHWINPAVTMQEAFAQIVQTDQNTYQRFQEAIAGFHKQLTAFYFEKLFWDKPILQEDYAQLPVFEMHDNPERQTNVVTSMLKIFSLGCLLFIIGYINFRGRKKR